MTDRATPLTAGQLLGMLANVDPETPVMFQRIDDESLRAGFEARKLVFETISHAEVDAEVAADIGKGQEVIMAEYLPALSGWRHPFEKLFVLNAHLKFCET